MLKVSGNQENQSIQAQLDIKIKKLYKIKNEFELLTSYIYKNNITDEDIHDSIYIINQELEDSFSSYFDVTICMDKINDDPYCEFKGHCQSCHNMTHKTYMESRDYCKNDCVGCRGLREEEKKNIKNSASLYYNTQINKKNIYFPTLPETLKPQNTPKQITNVTNINTINNITINNIQNNYIDTKDLIFNVIITSRHNKAEEKLKYIFTYLMCGASGKKLFPNEPKHSKSISYPVTAAIYYIHNNNNEYILHGVLRYKYKKECSMTSKKLESMVDKDTQIKVIYPTRIDQRHHFSIHDIDDMLYPMINQNCIGSDLEKFYHND
jgi:hypothetical protein